jgi:transcriptional regulator with XRE-family HTH domain
MRTPFAIRLAQALAASDASEGEVARMAGVSPGQLSRWKNATEEEGPVPLITAVEGLLRAMPTVNGHWLLTGEGSPELPTGDEAIRLRVIGRIVNGDVDARLLDATGRPGSTQEIADALIDYLRRRASGE